jgi:hypothetical protein
MKFSTLAILRSHQKRHDDPNFNKEKERTRSRTGKHKYTYPCFQCEEYFPSKVTAAEHMTEKHNFVIENVEKMCFECKEEVEDPVAHAMTHNCKFPCTHCSLRFKTQETFDKHWKQRHENVDRPFACSLCRACFKTASNLRSHEGLVHTSNEDKRFACEICERKFSMKYLLRGHIETFHSDARK